MSVIGRPFFLDYSLCFFPGHDNSFIIVDKADELATRLKNMPHARPQGVKRALTYPCVVTNPKKKNGGVKVKVQPLIGTADEGLYLRIEDIEKLGLEYTGREVMNRQGLCKVYVGATFRFPNDHNGGTVEYHVPVVLGLNHDVAKTRRADASLNTKKEGIIGVPQLKEHLIFMHRGDVHMIDLSVIRASPSSFAEYFTSLSPISDILKQLNGSTPLRDSDVDARPPITLDHCLAVAAQSRIPPYNPFIARDNVLPAIIGLVERCRTCGKQANSDAGIKMALCVQCKVEKRAHRALYCNRECQTADWKARHKQEHAGTRAWDSDSMIN